MSGKAEVMIVGSRENFRKYAPAEVFDRIVEMESIPELLARCEKEYMELEAVQFNEKSYTYGELLNDVARMRGAMAEKGLKAGQRILAHLPNSYDLLVTFLAAASMGISTAIAPIQLPPPAIGGLVQMFRCAALVDADPNAPAGNVPLMNGTERGTAIPAADVKADAECAVLFTGGTTGKSKGAVLSHGAVMQGVVNGCYGYADVFNQRYMLNLPMSHVFGLIRGTLTSLYTGSVLFINQNPQAMYREAAAFKPTLWIAVPALAEMTLSLSRQFGRMMLGPDMKTIIAGAAAVPPYLTNEYYKRGISLFPGYGLTESANLVSGNPEFLAKPTSVGLPFPNQELKLVDGELWIRGKNMLTAYIGAAEPAFDEDGWFHTGDLARFDEDGFLYITGRTKEVIVLGNGENVSPAEVESHFNALQWVQDSQLFAKEDQGRTFLALEVVPRAAEMAGIEDGKAFLMGKLEEVNRSLPTAWQAAEIVIRDSDFQRSPAMKIVRYHKC